jgi:hypothetical protein
MDHHMPDITVGSPRLSKNSLRNSHKADGEMDAAIRSMRHVANCKNQNKVLFILKIANQILLE